jgi:hypothetical protein
MAKRSTNESIMSQHTLMARRKAFLSKSPWVLRITVHKGKPAPVMIIKERLPSVDPADGSVKGNARRLKDTGYIYGQALYRCIKPLQEMLARVCDADAVPLELHQLLTPKSIAYRGNLPVDEESGSKIALLFILQHHMQDLDRIELIAWRVCRFTREEAVYWLSRATQYGDAPNRWAQLGMRIMLGGRPGDEQITRMLQDFREQR